MCWTDSRPPVRTLNSEVATGCARLDERSLAGIDANTAQKEAKNYKL